MTRRDHDHADRPDLTLGLPGTERARLVGGFAQALALAVDPHELPEWRQLREHDAARALGSRLAARVLLVRGGDGRALMFRYVTDQGRDFWVLPGGGVEPGETLAGATLRELVEETGLALEEATLQPPIAVLFHLLPSRRSPAPPPRVQYAPVHVALADDKAAAGIETGGRELHWLDQRGLEERLPAALAERAGAAIGAARRGRPAGLDTLPVFLPW